MNSLPRTSRTLSDLELLEDGLRELPHTLQNQSTEENDGWRFSFPIPEHFTRGLTLG
jgi:hypothetical protein